MKKNLKPILISIITIIILLLMIPVNVLTWYYYQEDYVYERFIVKPNDEFTIRWMHSVELTPWEEIFKISNDYDIILDRTRFKQFGAGVPDSAGNKTEIVDGYIVFSGINQIMKELPYGVSHFSKHIIIFKDKTYQLYDDFKDGDRIVIYTEKIPYIKYLLKL